MESKPFILDIFRIILNTKRCDLYQKSEFWEARNMNVLFTAIKLNHTKVVELIVNSGQYDMDRLDSTLKWRGPMMYTPLMWAIYCRFYDNKEINENIFKFILSSTKNLGIRNYENKTALIFITQLQNSSNYEIYINKYKQKMKEFEFIFKYLIDSKESHPEVVDKYGKNALLY